MDSRAYASLTPGMETAEELDACTLLVNSQVCLHNALILCMQYTCDVLSNAGHVLQSILCISYLERCTSLYTTFFCSNIHRPALL